MIGKQKRYHRCHQDEYLLNTYVHPIQKDYLRVQSPSHEVAGMEAHASPVAKEPTEAGDPRRNLVVGEGHWPASWKKGVGMEGKSR